MIRKSIVCLFVRNNKVLIARRLPGKHMDAVWEFPGGKVEEMETEECAVLREMQEEFSIPVVCSKKICDSLFKNSEVELLLCVYSVDFVEPFDPSKIVLTEHSEIKWVSFDEIRQYEFVESDLSVLDTCVSFFKGNIK